MSNYKIVFTKNAVKELQKLDKAIARRIKRKLQHFINNRPLGLATRLTKPTDAQYRWRAGDYRILFDYDKANQRIIILKIQHRKEIYRS